MKRRWLALCVLAAALMSGCMNAHSLDRYGYVLAIGFDRGKEMPYEVTLMLQKTQLESNAQKSGGFTLISAECRNLYEAIETLSGSLPFRIDCARTALIVVSAELAKEEGAMTELINMSYARLRIRSNAYLLISLSSAHDALDGFQNELDPNLGKMQVNFASYAKFSGLIPVANIMSVMEAVGDKTHDAVLPLCGVTPEEPEMASSDSLGAGGYRYIGGRMLIQSDMKTGLAGSMLFDGLTPVGILDGQNTQMLMMVTGDFQEGRLQLPLSDGTMMSVYLRAAGLPRGEMTLVPAPKAKLRISLAADVETPEMKRVGTNEQVEALIEAALQKRFEQLFYGCRALGSDAFGLGRYAVRHFTDAAEWERYDWKTAYASATATLLPAVKLVDHLEEPSIE